MKGLMITLTALVFVVALSGLSMAEVYSYHAGELVDCKAREYVAIKDEKGNINSFNVKTGLYIRCDLVAGKSVWLAARGKVLINVSMVPEGVSTQQIEEKIKDIRQKAINALVKEGSPVSEDWIVYLAWKMAMDEHLIDPSSKLAKEVEQYFWALYRDLINP